MLDMILFKVDGHSYKAPAAWFVGAAHDLGSYEAAARHWHNQAMLEKRFHSQKVDRYQDAQRSS